MKLTAFACCVLVLTLIEAVRAQIENKYWSGEVISTAPFATDIDSSGIGEGVTHRDYPDEPEDIPSDSLSFAASDKMGGQIITWTRRGRVYRNPGGAHIDDYVKCSKAHVQILNHEGVKRYCWETHSSADPDGGLFVTDSGGDFSNQYAPLVAADGYGGAFVIWRERPAWTTQPFLYAQHISASGARLYSDTGMNLTPNGLNMDHASILGYWIDATAVGEAIVVVGVQSPYVSHGDIWAFELGATDTVWSTRVTSTGSCYDPYVAYDGGALGGIGGYVAWNDDRNPHPSVYGEWVSSIAQHVQWDPTLKQGKLISNFATTSEAISDFGISCAGGTFNPVYIYSSDSTSTIRHFWATSVNGGTGMPLPPLPPPSVAHWPVELPSAPRVVARSISADTGSAYVVSETRGTSAGGLPDLGNEIRVAYVSVGRVLGWGGAETVVSDGDTNCSYINPYIVTDGASGSVVSWIRMVSDSVTEHYSSVRCQKLDASGAPQWGGGDQVVFAPYHMQAPDEHLWPGYISGAFHYGANRFYPTRCAFPSEDGAGGALWAYDLHQIDTLEIRISSDPVDTTKFDTLYELFDFATVFAQRMDNSGGGPRFVNTELATTHGAGDGPVVTVSNPDSTLWVLWLHQSLTNSSKYEIRAQLLNHWGIRQLSDQGSTVPGTTNAIASYPTGYPGIDDGNYVFDAVTDDSGGFVLLWSALDSMERPDIFLTHIRRPYVSLEALWSTPGAANQPSATIDTTNMGIHSWRGRFQPRLAKSPGDSGRQCYYIATWVERTANSGGNPEGDYYKILAQGLYDDPIAPHKYNYEFNGLTRGASQSMTEDSCLNDASRYVLNPRICTDLAGGAWIAWWDGSDAPSPTSSVVVRHLGKHPHAGPDIYPIFLRPGPTIQSPICQHVLCTDSVVDQTIDGQTWPAGCYVAFVGDDTAGSAGDDVYLARVCSQQHGTWYVCGDSDQHRIVWEVDTVSGAAGNQTDPRIVFSSAPHSPGSKECVVSWQDHGSTYGTAGIYAQRCNLDAQINTPLEGYWTGDVLISPTTALNAYQNGQIYMNGNEHPVFSWLQSDSNLAIGAGGGTITVPRFDLVNSLYDNYGNAYWPTPISPMSDHPVSLGKAYGYLPDYVGLGALAVAGAWSEVRCTDDTLNRAGFVFAQKLFLNDSIGDATFAKRAKAASIKKLPLLQTTSNYPNPVRTETSISYFLPNPGMVQLTLFDVMGREVRRFESQKRIAGDQVMPIEATGLLPGVYFYIMQLPEEIHRGQLTIVK